MYSKTPNQLEQDIKMQVFHVQVLKTIFYSNLKFLLYNFMHALNSQTQSLEYNNLVTKAFKFSDPC